MTDFKIVAVEALPDELSELLAYLFSTPLVEELVKQHPASNPENPGDEAQGE